MGGLQKSLPSYLIALLHPYSHTQLKYRHVLMVVNTSLRSINSAGKHGNMATPQSVYSSDVIQTRERQLWKKITATDTHCLSDLLPNRHTCQYLYQHGHDYMLPCIHTECFKHCFVNRSLFNFIQFNVCKEIYTFQITPLLLYCKLAHMTASVSFN